MTMSEMSGANDDRERSPLHEQRDCVGMFDVDTNSREVFRTRVRKSGAVSSRGPLVSCENFSVYFVRLKTASSYKGSFLAQ